METSKTIQLYILDTGKLLSGRSRFVLPFLARKAVIGSVNNDLTVLGLSLAWTLTAFDRLFPLKPKNPI
ncbi:hypothetical protein [Arthrospiribacter ruber]|uniref:Uncharacterized protein n=1 Tax=Arthrospiribacter ruber TaxID=2487934 RepID=A0A951IUM6_9BACT|nr:hypothetical protein [Arthrospiribacter ruber]MBW3467490.1 hypothetical protein [Arthrospiribacter ruber]